MAEISAQGVPETNRATRPQAATLAHGIAPERLDELARAILAGGSPLRFEIATRSDEAETACRLRHAHVMAAGWQPSGRERDAQELERDDYDAGAMHVIAWDEERPLGTCRIIRPSRGHRLPVEKAFDLTVAPVGRTVEWGRLVVSGKGSGDRHYNVTSGLLARAWLQTRALGFHVIAGAASLPIIRLYRRLGFQVVVLGPGRDYWGEHRFPVRSATRPPGRRRRSEG